MLNNQYNTSQKKPIAGFSILDLTDLSSAETRGQIQGKWNSIMCITGGSSILQIDFDEFIALKNRVFYIEKYKVWNWCKVNGLKGVLIQFTDSFYNNIYTGNPKLKNDQTVFGEIPPFIMIRPGEISQWKTMSEVLFRENSSSKRNSKDIICLTLKIMILMYQRKSCPPGRVVKTGRKNQLLSEFRKLVNNKFSSLRTSKDYALELNITPNYLNAICQEFFLKTVTEVIQERVILEAKRLLIHTSLSISEIAYRLGFKDNSYFGRYFRKATGLTPNNFRSFHFNNPEN